MTIGQAKKKLIEVALPLEAINAASAKEKSIRHGHPSTLHLWWARRPLAACRAVLFASIVDDPSSDPARFPTEEAQEAERQRLFHIIEELVKWENTNKETVLQAARNEIMRATNGNPPPVLDPFCGGGSIPLEAQRLGLEAHGSDLNPVAVLITKAMIEIPQKFANRPPVHPGQPPALIQREWRGAQGLAEDVRYYGKWMRDEAERRIGHLYPKVTLPPEHGGGEATVIAWLWARTVKCPNPACGVQMPLVRSFQLATKKNKEAWIEPTVNPSHQPASIDFAVRTGRGRSPEGTVGRRGATCLVCGTPVAFNYLRSEAHKGRLNARLMAIVAEGRNGRIYLPPTEEHERVASHVKPTGVDVTYMPEQALGFRVQSYGMTKHQDLFTSRQLTLLVTLCELVGAAQLELLSNLSKSEGLSDIAEDYASSVATYLALAASKAADNNSTICSWMSGTKYEVVRNTFSRQALSMTWDYAESNPFAGSSGDYFEQVARTSKVLEFGSAPDVVSFGRAQQRDATGSLGISGVLISTDPPYYDNIGYADLSDYFYVWLRRALSPIYPGLFSTLLTPKSQELIATPFRFDGDRQKAQSFFEKGLAEAFARMREAQNQDYPQTVFYAFKQSESDEDEGTIEQSVLASTGWETMLEGLLLSGYSITGTWPMRTERTGRMRDTGSNALASSIVLVCRPRPADARPATRQEFLRALKRELPEALRMLQHGNVAPVDLAQASIGPGMAIFSRYSRVVESDGQQMRVRTALQLINQTLDEVLTEQEGEYDADTRWAIAWFEQHAHDDAPFGQADVLARAKNSAVAGLVEAGIVASRGGKVRLLRRDEFPADWDPASDSRLTVWEMTQQLIRALDQGGEVAAATLLRRIGARGETARDLAYRLYTTCERKGRAQEALAYNSLVVAWPQITQRSSEPVEGEQMRFA